MEINDYIKLPYTRLVQEMNDESGHYFYGRILELDGCQSTSDTLEGLHQNLNEAMEGYIETKIENNLPIPILLPGFCIVLIRLCQPINSWIVSNA